MASKKIERIELMKNDELKDIAFKNLKELIEGPYEIKDRNYEIIDEKTEWSDLALCHLYRMNVNLVQEYPFKTFFDKISGELLGFFDGCLYNTPIRAKEKVKADEIIDKIKAEIDIPNNAKLEEMNEMKHDKIKVDILNDIEFPPGSYLQVIWRKEGADNEDEYCEAYYNRDTEKLTYYFKNW